MRFDWNALIFHGFDSSWPKHNPLILNLVFCDHCETPWPPLEGLLSHAINAIKEPHAQDIVVFHMADTVCMPRISCGKLISYLSNCWLWMAGWLPLISLMLLYHSSMTLISQYITVIYSRNCFSKPFTGEMFCNL